jgi:hypothetical protein
VRGVVSVVSGAAIFMLSLYASLTLALGPELRFVVFPAWLFVEKCPQVPTWLTGVVWLANVSVNTWLGMWAGSKLVDVSRRKRMRDGSDE